MIWINVNQFVIFVIPNYRISAPNFSNIKIIFALSIFKCFATSKVLTFTLMFLCDMPCRVPVGNIQQPYD